MENVAIEIGRPILTVGSIILWAGLLDKEECALSTNVPLYARLQTVWPGLSSSRSHFFPAMRDGTPELRAKMNNHSFP